MAWESCGFEKPENDNVIFICHALTGDAHVAGRRPGETEPSGWWESMVGPGRGIDTDKFRVICANTLGGCMGTTGPSSINPATGVPYGNSFPRHTLGDAVNVFRMLLEQIGVKHLVAVVGGSFGGCEALEWMFAHPGEADKAIIIASTPALSAQAMAFDIVGRRAIVDDPNWQNGDYYKSESRPFCGLAQARQLAHITYLSRELMEKKFGREKQKEWLERGKEFADSQRRIYGTMFQIESYLMHQAEKFLARFDANSYLSITYALDNYDAAAKYGSLDEACARVKGKTLVVSLSGDWLFTPDQSRKLVSSLLKNNKHVSYCHLNVPAGHDGFLTHTEELVKVVGAFLAEPKSSVLKWQNRHYRQITEMIPHDAEVLDVGCGNGTLLNILEKDKNVCGGGVDMDVNSIIRTLKAGHDALWEDADDELAMIPDGKYDVSVLSETLQVVRHPRSVLKSLLRVADEAIVTFPNFAFIGVRGFLFWRGRLPVTRQLPFSWYDTPNIHLITLKDFIALCKKDSIEIKEIRAETRGFLGKLLLLFGFKNLGATRIIARIAKAQKQEPGSAQPGGGK